MRDPIVEETRKVGIDLLKKYDYDLKKLIAAMNAEEKKGNAKVVSKPHSKKKPA